MLAPVALLVTEAIWTGQSRPSDRKEIWQGKKASTSLPGMENSSDPVPLDDEIWS